MAEQPVTAQLVESTVSLRPALSRSLPEHSQAAAQEIAHFTKNVWHRLRGAALAGTSYVL